MKTPSKIIKITPEKQFILFYDRLRDELNRAYIHYEISKTLGKLSNTSNSEFNEATTFFSFTINANLYTTIMSICKFLDKRHDSLHLDQFFRFIRSNLSLFSHENYKKRLADQGRDSYDLEHWVKLHKEITADIVIQDEKKVAKLPVANLIKWRHKKLAHIEKELVINEMAISKENPIKINEIDDILLTLHDILNRYRIAFDGIEWIIGTPSPRYQIEFIFKAISDYRRLRKRTIP